MKMNSIVLQEALSEKYYVETVGKEISEFILDHPKLYAPNVMYLENQIYVGNVSDFLEPPDKISCMLIGLGGVFPAGWNSKKSTFIALPLENSITQVFNLIVDLFLRYSKWDQDITSILFQDASILKMIQVSEPVLGHPITFTNNRMQVISSYDPAGIYAPQPLVGMSHFNNDLRLAYISNCEKEGFQLYKTNEGHFYFSNIYKYNSFVGVLVLIEGEKPFTPGSCSLFRYLFKRVSTAIAHRDNQENTLFSTLKTNVVKLLHGELSGPIEVNSISPDGVLSKNKTTLYCCAVIRPRQHSVAVTWESYCEMIERQLSGCLALFQDNHIIAVFELKQHEDVPKACQVLEPLFEKLSLHAGISDVFEKLHDLRSYYLQAQHALKIGNFEVPNEKFYHFRSFIHTFLFRNSPGGLPLACLIPQELLSLRPDHGQSGGVDYWETLKTFLDNEMNTAQTARDLYIHRTTLQARLDKINSIVSLKSPEDRFLVRYYLRLYEALEN